MKKEIAKKWVRALRSKKYKRGAGYLKIVRKNGEARHCCLGVLCELYQAERKRDKKPLLSIESGTGYSYLEAGASVTGFGDEGEAQVLPQRVQRWAGLKDMSGDMRGDLVPCAGNSYPSLAGLNDAGCSFARIADIIEARVNDL
jgi:hypothetical protein